MKVLRRKKEELILALQECSIYQTFLEKKRVLDEYPDKRQAVDQARHDNYYFYNDPGAACDSRGDELSAQMERLRMDQVIDEYLDAELAMCRLVQDLTADILQSIDMKVDFI